MYGSRSILPISLQPAKYDYFVKYDPILISSERELQGLANSNAGSNQTEYAWEEAICPICLESVHNATNESLLRNLEQNQYFKQIVLKKNEYMKAPCGHIFHIPCLLNWMDVKLECPSCRCALPPV